MKNTIFILVAIALTSCTKQDNINHYLNEKITEEQLIENGFYKYTYADTITEEDDINGPVGTIFKYELYSNVKPQRQDDGKLYPFQLFGNSKLDKEKLEEKLNYVTNELDKRVITYLFVNDTLDFKSIFVFWIDKNNKEIVDFTSEKKILEYYKNQKVSVKQRLGGIKYGKDKMEFPYRFRIGNYESGIYILKDPGKDGYQMITVYENVKENEETQYTFRHINPDGVYGWYSGRTYELSK
ncbi:hypothetical protein NTJ12_002423 [Flavobacterium psychrophilum]|nr:hypothetical protein [Flavobacterium psychrophilum]